jgi:hypothetical protein
MYAPVYNLRSGEIIKGYRFIDVGTSIKIESFNVYETRDHVEFISNIATAWDIYEEEMIRSIAEF